MPSTRAGRRLVLGSTLIACACVAHDSGYTQPNKLFPVPDGEVKAADWSLALAEAMCSFKERCNDPELTADSYRAESCIEYFRRGYEDSIDVAGLVAEGHIDWDPAAYGQCVALEARAGCEDEAPRRPCYAGHGKLEEGDACQFDAECGAELFCDGGPGCGGHCQRTLRKGSDCEHQFQCEQGLSCLEVDGSRQCRPTPTRGSECWNDPASCGPNMHCDIFEGYDDTGSCQPIDPMFQGPDLIKAGESCNISDVCLGNTKCRPSEVDPDGRYAYASCLAAVPDGERCLRADSELRSACKDGSYCEAEGNLAYGRCVPRLAQGEPCAGEDPHECLEGQRCTTTSTCQPMHHARRGEACLIHDECYSRRCYDDVCSGDSDCR